MNLSQIFKGGLLVLVFLISCKVVSDKNSLPDKANIGNNSPIVEAKAVNFSEENIPVQNGGPVRYLPVRDTLLGLVLYEVPLPDEWEIGKGKWSGPGNTFLKEHTPAGSPSYNVNMAMVIERDVSPVLNAMDKQITSSMEYPDLAKSVLKSMTLDSVFQMDMGQISLEVKGVEFEGRKNQKGMVLIQLWTMRYEYANYYFPTFIWMEGDSEFFIPNKEAVLYGLKHIRYNAANIKLKEQVLSLKGRMENNSYRSIDDFIYDEELGKMVRWSAYHQKRNTAEKTRLNKELIAKGVCPERLNEIWNREPYQLANYNHADYFSEDLPNYAPADSSKDFNEWRPYNEMKSAY